ncbi:hypothetical protein IJI17_01300 [Candidatus Saccharibacteria bacterium]|nr:hypothetical protein [Candidatus Saccharibacteria bacterium]
MGGKRKKLSLKTWQLFLIFVLLCFASATLLRLDHIQMTTLRSEVLAADAEGNAENLAASLNRLKSFTTKNIIVNVVESNGVKRLEFGTGVFYLEQSYLRDAGAALASVAETEIDDSNPNGNVYALASAVCRPLAIKNGWSWNHPDHIACYQSELAKYPAEDVSNATITAELPSTELYRREFVSPVWAPTASGFVLLVAALLGVVIFIRFLIWLILEISLVMLKSH